MTNAIKPGDVVRLKSHSGFPMTVGKITDDGTEAECYWAVDSRDTHEVKHLYIPVCALER